VRGITVAFGLWLLLAQSAAAASFVPQIQVAREGVQISGSAQGAKLFVLTYSCGSGIGGDNRQTIFADTLSIGFFLTKGQPAKITTEGTLDAATTSFLGSSLLYADAGSVIDNTQKCRGAYVFRGKDDAHLMFLYKRDSKAQTALLTGFASVIGKVIGPMVTLATGNVLAADLQNRFNSANTVATELASFLTLFNKVAKDAPVVPLDVDAKYVVYTPKVAVTFEVREVESLLLGPALFKAALETYDVVTPFADNDLLPENIKGKCNQVAEKWVRDEGVTNKVDLAYVLFSHLRGKVNDKAVFLNCLGRDIATAARPYLSNFDMATSGLSYDDADIARYLPSESNENSKLGTQPTYDPQLEIKVSELIGKLARETQPPGLRGEQKLNFYGTLLTEELTVEDQVSGYPIMDLLSPGSSDSSVTLRSEDALRRLSQVGFQRWGCFNLTRAKPALRSTENEAVVMVAYRASKEQSLDGVPAYVVRLLYSPADGRDRLAWLIFTDTLVPKDLGC